MVGPKVDDLGARTLVVVIVESCDSREPPTFKAPLALCGQERAKYKAP